MANRVDAHAHVIDRHAFPFEPGVGYTPCPDENGTLDELQRTLAAGQVTHALLVQPSCYGYDNTAMLEAIARSDGRYKGIGVVPLDVTEETLSVLADSGVVGVRLNLEQSDRAALRQPATERYLSLLREIGWYVEVYAAAELWVEIYEPLRAAGVTVLVDHFGAPIPEYGVDQPGFKKVLRLGRETNSVVKLSAPYRPSRQGHPYSDLAPYAEALVEAFGIDRCLWGSDWPFLNASRAIQYNDLGECLRRWLPSAADQRNVLWDNPARLFAFASTTGNGLMTA